MKCKSFCSAGQTQNSERAASWFSRIFKKGYFICIMHFGWAYLIQRAECKIKICLEIFEMLIIKLISYICMQNSVLLFL